MKGEGYVLSVDQASNAAGVSLWLNRSLVGHAVLKSKSSKDSFSRRIQAQAKDLKAFLDAYLPAGEVIRVVLFESVKSRIIMAVIGSVLVHDRIDATLTAATMIPSMRWKKWAQGMGATGPLKDIKGVPALREVKFDVDGHGITSEDVSDSVLIFLTWVNTR
jgi:hypothetical protein